MRREYTSGVRSKAAIAGHPPHPIFIIFPAAFLIGLLASDIVYANTRAPFWASASLWLALAGLVMGAVAAIFGLTEFASISRVREVSAGWIHGLGNILALVLTLINVFPRLDDPAAFILPSGLLLSGVVTIILLVTAWMGGELVYRYGVGVMIRPATATTDERRYTKAA